jgi:hypothetical protein
LVGLRERLRILRVGLANPFTTLREIDVAYAGLRRIVQAVKWLGKKHLPAFREEATGAGSLEGMLVADLASVHLGDPGGVERLLKRIEIAASEESGLPAIVGSILRTIDGTSALDDLQKVFLRSPSQVLIGLLLPILAEDGRLSAEELLDFAKHPSDDVAVPAAEALAWSGSSRDGSILLSWAHHEATPRRANVLLFAATALGSSEALAEVRKRLSGPAAAASFHLVEAMAIAGDDSDADRLLALVALPEADGAHVLLAAASLGSTGVLVALPALANMVPQNALEEARRMIAGRELVGTTTARPRTTEMRLLHGEPWSVSGLLSRLAAPDEPIQSQQRLALEVRVRTGLAPPTRFPSLMSRSTSAELVASWRAHFARAQARLKPGVWHFQGKPIEQADKEGGIR